MIELYDMPINPTTENESSLYARQEVTGLWEVYYRHIFIGEVKINPDGTFRAYSLADTLPDYAEDNLTFFTLKEAMEYIIRNTPEIVFEASDE